MAVSSHRNVPQLCLSDVEVRLQDVRTLRSALRECEADRLLDWMLWDQAGWGAQPALMPGVATDALRRKLSSLVQLMLSMPEARRIRSEVIIPWQRFSVADERGLFARNVGASLLDPARAPLLEEALRAFGGRKGTVGELEQAAHELGGAAFLDALEEMGVLRGIGGLSGLPWPEALDMRIWLPEELTDGERHMVLGHIIWAMACDGGAAGSGMAARDAHPLCLTPDAAYLEKLRLFVALLNYESCAAAEPLLCTLAQAL